MLNSLVVKIIIDLKNQPGGGGGGRRVKYYWTKNKTQWFNFNLSVINSNKFKFKEI